MASTITLQNTVNWALPFTRYAPITIGTANEPTITNANLVMQTILGPPFIWRWNRTSTSTVTVSGTQDYVVALPNFGFFEKATVTDGNGYVTELEWKELLSGDNTASLARPTFVSTQLDDGAGNITFRLMPIPDGVYTLSIIYQKQAPIFSSLSTTWTPIPDYLSYVYSRGFLALSLEATDDPRFQVEHTRFIASLLSCAEGLSESQKNIFLGNALNTDAQMMASQIRTQQGGQARGS